MSLIGCKHVHSPYSTYVVITGFSIVQQLESQAPTSLDPEPSPALSNGPALVHMGQSCLPDFFILSLISLHWSCALEEEQLCSSIWEGWKNIVSELARLFRAYA